MKDNIFAKIIAREIPADFVYEDEVVLAFLTIAPNNHGHTLVIPKKHFVNIFDGDPETLAHMMKVGQKIALALKKAGLAEGVNLVMNNGEEAGQEVWHSHLHVVPRLKDDCNPPYKKPKHIAASAEDFASSRAKIIAAL